VWTALMALWSCCWKVFTPVGGSGLWWLPVGRLEKIKTRGEELMSLLSAEKRGAERGEVWWGEVRGGCVWEKERLRMVVGQGRVGGRGWWAAASLYRR
jgi:hypothetical protein